MGGFNRWSVRAVCFAGAQMFFASTQNRDRLQEERRHPHLGGGLLEHHTFTFGFRPGYSPKTQLSWLAGHSQAILPRMWSLVNSVHPKQPSLAALGPPRSEDLFVEARRAPALAALLGLRSEDLFVEGPPGARERSGRPSPTLADLVRICAWRNFSSSAPKRPNFSRSSPLGGC